MVMVSSENPNKCKSKKTYIHNFLPEVPHTIKTQNFDDQNWSDFSLPGWTGSYIFEYLL